MGLTIAFAVQPAQTIVGQHFKERRALAMGLVSTGSALGGIGFPLMFEKLLPRLGFATTLRLTALKIGLVRLPICNQMLTTTEFAIRLHCISQAVGRLLTVAKRIGDH